MTAIAKPHAPELSKNEPVHIISLGAGVQSSCMALMAAKGEITPMPAAAIFADTGDEPFVVYRWLTELKGRLPFETFRAFSKHGILSENIVNEWEHSHLPAFFPDGASYGIGKRQCTSHWKITPVRRLVREMFPNQPVTMWMGISTDEISRAKDANVQWLTHRFPLIEMGMNRQDCIRWLEKNGIANVPKSACVFCPYKSDRQWRELKKLDREWNKILKVDAILTARGEYLHKSCKPISEVDFSTEEERGQINMFNNECEGMCGV